MTKILIAIPTFETVSTETFESIFNLEKIPGVEIELRFVKGYGCAKARNEIANISINEKFDYVLMVDSDVVLPKNTLERIKLWVGFDIVLGYYPKKYESSMSEIFKLGGGYNKETQMTIAELKNIEADLVQIRGGGFGCAFIKTSLFNKLRYPYFVYVEYEDKTCLSEDLYFCEQVNKANVRVYVDPKLGCDHIGKKIVKC